MFPFKLTPKRQAYLKELELENPFDVVSYFPRTYNRYNLTPLGKEQHDLKVVIKGEVKRKERVVRFGRNKSLFKFTLIYDEDEYDIICFNRDYLEKTIKYGDEVLVVGKYNHYRKEINLIELQTKGLDKLKIKAIYRLPEGITNYEFQLLLNLCFQALLKEGKLEEIIPSKFKEKYRLGSRLKAYNDIHFSNDEESLKQALRYLKYEELLVYSLKLQILKSSQKAGTFSSSKSVDNKLLSLVIDGSGFILTEDQKFALEEIVTDLEKPGLMYRMLQGDVGSGKTLVASLGLVANYSSGYQGVLMAPTDILARQHYKFLSEFLKDYPISIALLVASLTAKEKREVLAKISSGEVDIVVGTHALIQEGVSYQKLGLAVIDEQHRFGVKQRQLLKDKGQDVELLMMSATPIPRSLAITLYGDMDISTLHSFPSRKREVVTKVLKGNSIKTLLGEIEERVSRNERVFIVCPLIEDEDSSRRNVNDVYEGLTKYFKDRVKLGLVHGKMGDSEKEETMLAFQRGELGVLVATTVIEVGIDVKEASMMIIYDAQSFGLAALHQLRGRIGRAGQKASCYLLCSSADEQALKRLNYLVDHDDGFEIARFDLANRGPGDVVGTRQSGIPDLVLADIHEDLRILEIARDDAKLILKEASLPENKQIIAYCSSKKL